MSTDAVLVKLDQRSPYDFTIASNGDINTDNFFDSSILVSLFTDKRALPAEMPVSELRRGWIGDESNQDGFEGGSKIWLYEQAPLTRDTLNGIATEAFNSLVWLTNDELAINLNAQADLIDGVVTITITIARPNSKIEKRFYTLWENTASRG